MATLAKDLGLFVSLLTLRGLPPEVVDKDKSCLLNAYGMGLDCHDTPYAPVVSPDAIASRFLTLWLISPAKSSRPSSACFRPVTSIKMPNMIL